ncbi:MAG: GIY-YIG nuclease family protein [Verrucomicrobiota bacterium]|nr:GIY-YIG nuclease family protein [Verrucomicrobiota bacterium]
MAEFLYILENPSFPGIVKIGMTERDVAGRAKELSCATGVPTEFTVFKQYIVDDAAVAERRVHERLSKYRLSENREFFRLSSDDAAAIIEEMFAACGREMPNYDRDDKLFFAATEIAITAGKIEWPGMLAGPLKISHDEAIRLITGLRARGILNAQNDLCADLQCEHRKRVQNIRRRQQMEEQADLARKKIHYEMILQVKELLAGLADPETGEEAQVQFENDKGNLVVAVHGTEWVRSEAQKRLAALQ